VISSLRGTLLDVTAESAAVEVNGVGYAVCVGAATLDRLPSVGSEAFLWIAESVAMYGGGATLYGFLTKEERQIFNVLRDNVPGTGAKKALEFLDKAAKSLPDFRRAVMEKDQRALVSLFGFTAKTAEKIIAGLQRSVGDLAVGKGPEKFPIASSFEEAVQGLVALGYKEPVSRQAAQSARGALTDGAGAEDLIREALRHLAGRR
jgi:Holliday junction DNA helicase RuvA